MVVVVKLRPIARAAPIALLPVVLDLHHLLWLYCFSVGSLCWHRAVVLHAASATNATDAASATNATDAASATTTTNATSATNVTDAASAPYANRRWRFWRA